MSQPAHSTTLPAMVAALMAVMLGAEPPLPTYERGRWLADSLDAMEAFASDHGVQYELLRDPDGAFVDALEVVTFPKTFFVDASGTIVGETGVLDADALREHIEGHF